MEIAFTSRCLGVNHVSIHNSIAGQHKPIWRLEFMHYFLLQVTSVEFEWMSSWENELILSCVGPMYRVFTHGTRVIQNTHTAAHKTKHTLTHTLGPHAHPLVLVSATCFFVWNCLLDAEAGPWQDDTNCSHASMWCNSNNGMLIPALVTDPG